VAVNGKLRVERAGTLDLPAGVVREGDVLDVDLLTEGLKELWGRNKGLDEKVRIGLATARIVVRTIDVPNVSNPKELRAAVRAMAADALPMPLESAALDFGTVGLVQTPDGPRKRVVLVAARRDMVDKICDAARSAGLKPQGVDLSAFAMIRALGGGEGSIVYLSVGGLTNLAIAVDGVCVFTRVTGGGLETMAIELADERGLSLEDARSWLRIVGLEAAVGDIAGDPTIVAATRAVLSAGLRRIASEIRTSLDFFGSQAPAVPVDGASVPDRRQRRLLTGAATSIPGFTAALEAALERRLEVRNVEATKPLAGIDLARVTIAAGLAVREART
jgi:type IV pilus assembly protein PilM